MFRKFLSATVIASVCLFATSCLKNDDNTTSTPNYRDPSLEISSIDSFTNAMGYYNMVYDAQYEGFKYEILAYGDTTNYRPTNSQPYVTVSYKGTLLNGTIFDSTSTQATSADTVRKFNLAGNIIGAWVIGVQKIGKGGHIRFVTPSAYAYGNSAQGSIPANSPLFFDIYLKNVTGY